MWSAENLISPFCSSFKFHLQLKDDKVLRRGEIVAYNVPYQKDNWYTLQKQLSL